MVNNFFYYSIEQSFIRAYILVALSLLFLLIAAYKHTQCVHRIYNKILNELRNKKKRKCAFFVYTYVTWTIFCCIACRTEPTLNKFRLSYSFFYVQHNRHHSELSGNNWVSHYCKKKVWFSLGIYSRASYTIRWAIYLKVCARKIK